MVGEEQEVLPKGVIDVLPSDYANPAFLVLLRAAILPIVQANMEALGSGGEEAKEVLNKEDVSFLVIGDSGAGANGLGQQLAGALAEDGYNIRPQDAKPSSIRAKVGVPDNTSGVLVRAGGKDVLYPGEQVDIVYASDAAGLKSAFSRDLIKPGATIIADTDHFGKKQLAGAGYDESPFKGLIADGYNVIAFSMTKSIKSIHGTLGAEFEGDENLKPKEKALTRNYFALGMMLSTTGASVEPVIRGLKAKYTGKRARFYGANVKSLLAGYAIAEKAKKIPKFDVAKPEFEPGDFMAINGTQAATKALQVIAYLTGKSLSYSSYPITPATNLGIEIMEAMHAEGITALNFPDEVSAAAAALGSAYSGHIGVVGTSGPGISLMNEVFAAAVMMEQPLVIFDVQRGGTATGAPTKSEQSDTMQAVWGRHGSAPMIVVSPKSVEDVFYKVIEGYKLALETGAPLMIMFDAEIADGLQNMEVPDLDKIREKWGTPKQNVSRPVDEEGNPTYLERNGDDVVPAIHPGDDDTRLLSGLDQNKYTKVDFSAHGEGTLARANKLELAAERLPDAELIGNEKAGVLIVSYGYNYGVTREVVNEFISQGRSVSHLNLDYIHPLQKNAEKMLLDAEANGIDVIVVESNLGNIKDNPNAPESQEFQGQLAYHLQGKLGIEVNSFINVHTGYIKKENLTSYIETFLTPEHRSKRNIKKFAKRMAREADDWAGYDHLEQMWDYAYKENGYEAGQADQEGELCVSCATDMMGGVEADSFIPLEQVDVAHGNGRSFEIADPTENKLCPGCGDEKIRKTMRDHFDKLVANGEEPGNIVLASGIGCSGRLTFYFGDGHMVHFIHGRASSFLLGLLVANPNLKVYGVAGDGDSYLIGLSHMNDLVKKNPNLTYEIILNDVLGLTKNDHGPQRDPDDPAANTPWGSAERAINGMGNLLANGATHLTRTLADDTDHHAKMLDLGEEFEGTTIIENIALCTTYNQDGYEQKVGRKNVKEGSGIPHIKDSILYLEEGEPIKFGNKVKLGIIIDGLKPKIVRVTEENEDMLMVHHATNDGQPDNASYEQARVLLEFGHTYKKGSYIAEDGTEVEIDFPTPIGEIYRNITVPTYQEALDKQQRIARKATGKETSAHNHDDVQAMIATAMIHYSREAESDN